jgi:sRNA-binding protein
MTMHHPELQEGGHTMLYRRNRTDSEEIIAMLAKHYPATFFVQSNLRRPLKKDIIEDVIAEGFPAARELIEAGVDYYQSHLAYQYALTTGVSRLDINGKEVSVVTKAEHEAAKKLIAEINQKRSDKNAAATLATLHANGRIPDDQLKKLDAPPMTTPSTGPPKTILPELEPIHTALIAANTTLATITGPLQAAMVAAALRVMIDEAQRVIDNLTEAGGLNHSSGSTTHQPPRIVNHAR